MQAVSIKCIWLVAFLVIVGTIPATEAGGLCGRHSSPDEKAVKVLYPCLRALKDNTRAANQSCCYKLALEHVLQKPACLCAVVLSKTAKTLGVKPEAALTLSKRCFADAHAYKCGADTIP